ncbi:MAG: hypothetical protein Q8920_03350 [Bacillota bacterium]|nr:hypothetical protein [Bacillota bacterium]
MRHWIGDSVKIACIYVATIIGAGFASGQEIVQFFSNYFKGGYYGIITAGILFSIIGYIVLDKVYRGRIRNYEEFLFPSVGWLMGWMMEIVSTLFMISVFCVMIAGMGNIIQDKLGIHFNYGIVIMAVFCMMVILTDIKGIVSLSTIVTPIMILGILAIGLYIIICKDTAVFNTYDFFKGITKNWFFSSLIYVSYNSIIAITVMCSMLPYLKSRRTAVSGGILGGAFLCVIALVLNTAIMIFSPGSLSDELPVLGIVKNYGSIVSVIYTFVLWLAMFLSAVTSGYCFVNRLSMKMRISPKIIAAVVCAVVIPMSSMGFSRLIATVYPIFGYIGLFLVFVVLTQGFRDIFLRVTHRGQ